MATVPSLCATADIPQRNGAQYVLEGLIARLPEQNQTKVQPQPTPSQRYRIKEAVTELVTHIELQDTSPTVTQTKNRGQPCLPSTQPMRRW